MMGSLTATNHAMLYYLDQKVCNLSMGGGDWAAGKAGAGLFFKTMAQTTVSHKNL